MKVEPVGSVRGFHLNLFDFHFGSEFNIGAPGCEIDPFDAGPHLIAGHSPMDEQTCNQAREDNQNNGYSFHG